MMTEDPRHEEETPLTKEQEDEDSKAALQARITVNVDPSAPSIFRYVACLDDDCEPGRPMGRGATEAEAVHDLMESLDMDEWQREVFHG